MNAPTEIIWAFIGLLLTIGGNFLEASMTNPPWNWTNQGIEIHSLGVTYQIGAVLLVGCLGGKNAGVLSQIAYLVLGFSPWFSIFAKGGGLDYLKEPTLGYLLGFIPGAWICGWLAFKIPPRLEFLAFSCLCGLFTIHIIGLSYLITSSLFSHNLLQNIWLYSIYPIPGQLAVICAVTILAFTLRQLMFY